jgi:hypothetical protein
MTEELFKKGREIHIVAGTLYKKGIRSGWIHNCPQKLASYAKFVPIIVIVNGIEITKKILPTSFRFGKKETPPLSNGAQQVIGGNSILEGKIIDFCNTLARSGIAEANKKDFIAIFVPLLESAINQLKEGRQKAQARPTKKTASSTDAQKPATFFPLLLGSALTQLKEGRQKAQAQPTNKTASADPQKPATPFRMPNNGRFTIGGEAKSGNKKSKMRPNEGDANDIHYTDEDGCLHL